MGENMPSLQSSLFLFALKYRHLLRFKLKRTNAIDCNTSIPELRLQTEKGASFFGKLPDGFSTDSVDIDGLYAEWIRPAIMEKERAILYFHGGGYVIGSCKAHRSIVAKFVQRSGIPALVFDYRLAPEHPFPAAVEDSVAAYQWLLRQGLTPDNIVFVGDSAGGGLCLATLLALKDKQQPLPAAAVALSPWTDVKNTGDSWQLNANVDTLCWKEAQTVFGKYYAGNTDPGHPWISPLYGDLHNLPPLLIYVGGDETLLSDSTRFAEKARESGVNVCIHIGDKMFHCYPACSPLFPEARQAMAEICSFIKSSLRMERKTI
jgi:acetyl esterase/lipase